MKKQCLVRLFGSFMLVFGSASEAFAWGAKGHDVIAKLAAEVFVAKYQKDASDFGRVLKEKSEMLGHLANVPDVYWKSLPRDVTSVLNPSHYVDMEYASLSPTIKRFPRELRDFVDAARSICEKSGLSKRLNCKTANEIEILKVSGSVQFRIRQLAKLMQNELVALKNLQQKNGIKPEKGKSEKDHVDKALLYAGLIAHFVGDLGQPFHASVDYDGWMVNQGGIHAYFEVDLVNVLSNSWEDEVLDFALAFEPARKLVSDVEKSGHRANFLNIAIALGVDSLDEKDRVLFLDKSHALLKKSSKNQTKELKIKAKRKRAKDTVVYFRQVLKERFAVAADVLAFVWYQAYVNAGSPDLKKYKSYYYPLKPEPIPLDYL